MQIKNIDCFNYANGSLDVIVTLQNDASYMVELVTLEALSTYMKKDFLPPDYPYIIVSKLTDDIIRAAIQEFIDEEEDSYWLKLYHLTATLEIDEINEILNRKKKEQEAEEAEEEEEEESDIDQ